MTGLTEDVLFAKPDVSIMLSHLRLQDKTASPRSVALTQFCFQQRLDTTFLNRALVAVERVPGQAHELTGLRDIAQFLDQI